MSKDRYVNLGGRYVFIGHILYCWQGEGKDECSVYVKLITSEVISFKYRNEEIADRVIDAILGIDE